MENYFFVLSEEEASERSVQLYPSQQFVFLIAVHILISFQLKIDKEKMDNFFVYPKFHQKKNIRFRF